MIKSRIVSRPINSVRNNRMLHARDDTDLLENNNMLYRALCIVERRTAAAERKKKKRKEMKCEYNVMEKDIIRCEHIRYEKRLHIAHGKLGGVREVVF